MVPHANLPLVSSAFMPKSLRVECSPMNLLKNLAALALVFVTVSCTAGRPPRTQSWKDATGAEAYERSFWKAIQERNFDVAERRLAPIYTLTTESGIAGRDKAIEYFRSLSPVHVGIADLQVNPEGADMVVSYVATIETKSSPTPKRYYMTTVWQQVKRGWIAI